MTTDASKRNFVILEHMLNCSAKVYYKKMERFILSGRTEGEEAYKIAEQCLEEDMGNIIRLLQGEKIIPGNTMLPAGTENSAKRIIEHYGLNDRFSDVIGPDKSEKSPDKKMLIERAIAENDIADKASVIMVGDRFYDIVGAMEAGVDSIGVLYGYGNRSELEEAGATYIAETPEDILKFVL